MSFIYPSFLWLFLPLLVYLVRRKRKQSFQQNLRWGAFLFLILAIARPVISQAPTKEMLPAHSIILALDLSASMSAEDIKPTRAKASRETIRTFLKENQYDQISLIGFTINPLLLSPPTTDHRLVALALESMKSDYIMTKGTSIKKLLEKVAKFSDGEKKLILFSDGGDEQIDEELVDFVKSSYIKILIIAMATEKGATVKDKNGGALEDKAGHLVISKFNNSLSRLGEVIAFSAIDETVQNIERWIKNQKLLKDGVKKEIRNDFELFFLPTFLALVLLFLSATHFSLKLVALLALLNINLQAEEILNKEQWGEGQHIITQEQGILFDGYYLQQAYEAYENRDYNSTLEALAKIEEKSLESELTLAHAYYKLEQYQKAKDILKNIKTTRPKVKQQLLYELGNCEAKQAYYEKAKESYVKALQFGEDEDILHNLAWVMFQKKLNKSKVGFTNPSSPQNVKNSVDNVESKETNSSKKENKSGEGKGNKSKKSKSSTVKMVKSSEKSNSKKVLSSKAYDLINKGYIRETKPW